MLVGERRLAVRVLGPKIEDGMTPLLTDRAQLIAQLDAAQEFDIAIIGGGATGLGVAVDAAVRGLKVVLLEAHDFAKGTSSRSTKLVHGGVRYLAQGHLPLVWEALRERQHLLSNAPHLVHPMPFVMPAYRRTHQLLYGLGLKLYDLLAGPARLGPRHSSEHGHQAQRLREPASRLRVAWDSHLAQSWPRFTGRDP